MGEKQKEAEALVQEERGKQKVICVRTRRGKKAKENKNKKMEQRESTKYKTTSVFKLMIPFCLYKFQTQAFGVWPLAHASYSFPYISEPSQASYQTFRKH